MLNELVLASQSVQALGTLLKAASGLANYNEIVAKVSEVNSKLMAANAVALAGQEKQAELAGRIRDLEAQLEVFQTWIDEAAGYEAREVASGVFAHVLVGQSAKLTSATKLCSNCFNQGKKSLLQQQHVEVGRQLRLVCHRCMASLVFRGYIEQA